MSLLCLESPDLIEVLRLLDIEVLWHPALSNSTPAEHEQILERIIPGHLRLDVLCIEGAIIRGPGGTGMYDVFGGKPKKDLLAALSKQAEFVIAVGTCASFGGIGADGEVEATGTQYHKWNKGGFLPKPAQRHKILDIMEALLKGEREKPDMEKRESIVTQHSILENSKRSIRILLAEDNPVNQKLAKTMLTKAGYQVEVAGNGEEAFKKYTAKTNYFDLIFMDLQMPSMDGLRATEAIRKYEKETDPDRNEPGGPESAGQTAGRRHIPIVAMTAHALKGDRERCLQAGMDDYISKPIRREKVFEIAAKWVLANSSISEPPIRIEEQAAGLGLETDEFLELVEVFVDTTRSDLSQLQLAISAGDAQQVAAAAHSIKGAAGSLGFDTTQHLAKKIEMNARKQILEGSLQDIDGIDADIRAITQSLHLRQAESAKHEKETGLE